MKMFKTKKTKTHNNMIPILINIALSILNGYFAFDLKERKRNYFFNAFACGFSAAMAIAIMMDKLL